MGRLSQAVLVLGILFAATFLTVGYAREAGAAWTGWYYDAWSSCTLGSSACKYNAARVEIVSVGPGLSRVATLHARGATASGTCDPSNNVTSWRVYPTQSTSAFLYRLSNGAVLWLYSGPTSSRTNCGMTVSSALHQFGVGATYESGTAHRMVVRWRHQISGGSSFDSEAWVPVN